MIGPRPRKLRFAVTGLIAAGLALVAGGVIVLRSTPASACWESRAYVPNCDSCYVDGGSTGSDDCDMLYAGGNGYCDAGGSTCVSD
jgi:hypothetical protein